MSGPPAGPPPGISGADRVNARLAANKLATLLPFIIGTYIDTVLLGFVVVALFYWVRHVRPTDRTWIKVLITLQTVFTCIQTGVLMSGWFRIFIKGFGDPRGIMDASSARFVGMIHVCQWLPTAFFFLVRAYNLIGTHWAVWIPIGVLMLASFSAGIAGTVIFRSIPPPPMLQTLTVFRTAAEVAVDIIITASIFYGYWRNQTGWDSTDKVIKRLMRWTIETQAPPTIGVLGFMITIIVQGEGPAQTYWYFLPKLYTGDLIWAVNARIKVEKELRTFAGVYTRMLMGQPPGSRNPDKAMPALRAIGRFNSADEEEEPEVDQVQTGIVDSKMNSTSALIQSG